MNKSWRLVSAMHEAWKREKAKRKKRKNTGARRRKWIDSDDTQLREFKSQRREQCEVCGQIPDELNIYDLYARFAAIIVAQIATLKTILMG